MREVPRIALLVACTVLVPAGFARPGHAAAGDASTELARCARIEADARRLACFDDLARRVVASSTDAAASGPGSPVPATVNTAPSPSQEPADAQAPGNEPPTPARVRIERITERPYGERIFFLDNGERWTEQTRERTRFRVGDVATLERTSLGGFVLVREAGGATRVRALQ